MLGEPQVVPQLPVAADAPDLLIQHVVVHGESPPQAQTDLVPAHRSKPAVGERRAARKGAGGTRRPKIDDRREQRARAKEECRRPVDQLRQAVSRRLAVAVPVVKPHQPEILHVVKDDDEDGDQEEILIRTVRRAIDRLEARDAEVDRAVQ